MQSLCIGSLLVGGTLGCSACENCLNVRRERRLLGSERRRQARQPETPQRVVVELDSCSMVTRIRGSRGNLDWRYRSAMSASAARLIWPPTAQPVSSRPAATSSFCGSKVGLMEVGELPT